MLALTRKTEYALIALSHLARRSRRVVSAREIADTSGVPLPILTNTLKVLASTGIVLSARGVRGGYALQRPLDSISLRDLITATEGPVHLVRCALGEDATSRRPCDLEQSCPIRQPVTRIHNRLTRFLEDVSLAEIVGDTPSRAPVRSASTGENGVQRYDRNRFRP